MTKITEIKKQQIELKKKKQEIIKKKFEHFLKYISRRPDNKDILKQQIQFNNCERLKESWNTMKEGESAQFKRTIFSRLFINEELAKALQHKRWVNRLNFFIKQELDNRLLSPNPAVITQDPYIWNADEEPTWEERLVEVEYLQKFKAGTPLYRPRSIIEENEYMATWETEEEFWDDDELLDELCDNWREKTLTEPIFNSIRVEMIEPKWNIFGDSPIGRIEEYKDVYGLKHYSLYPYWKYNKLTDYIEPTNRILPFDPLDEAAAKKYPKFNEFFDIKKKEEYTNRIYNLNKAAYQEKLAFDEIYEYKEFLSEKEYNKVKAYDYFGLAGMIIVSVIYVYKKYWSWDGICYWFWNEIMDIKNGSITIYKLLKAEITNDKPLKELLPKFQGTKPELSLWIEKNNILEGRLPMFIRLIEYLQAIITTSIEPILPKIIEIGNFIVEIY